MNRFIANNASLSSNASSSSYAFSSGKLISDVGVGFNIILTKNKN